MLNFGADLYEIRSEESYTSHDLDYNDESTRATVEQKDDKARPALADKSANISSYETIVLAYPIWWGQALHIMDTFVESYDFTGKKITAICTSGGSDIGSSADYPKELAKGKAEWKQGRLFSTQTSAGEIKDWFDGLF
ncbi:flavodoxin [Mitsuokella multacida]|uniref:Flavodoxin n=1 Tax=Mitsuokella multacida DSM 20544 TaxID=500635 RepID=C9KP41_9FIRM|nr:flavodoxin [Mitsuokella multacida]EEX67996.1 flavodoxin [Mitsuokella multacida DSM 20544]